MADNQSQLDILIKTLADTTGFTLTREQAAALQQQLGKTGEATDELGKSSGKAAEDADKLYISHRGLHVLMSEMGRITVPELGHALGGMLYGPIGWAIGLTVAIRGVQEACAEAAKTAADFRAAMDSGADTDELSGKMDSFAAAVSKFAVAGDDFKRTMDGIATSQHSIKTDADAAIKQLDAEATALNAIAAARLKARQADIRADFESGRIDKAKEIEQLAALEDAAADSKQQRDASRRAKEIAIKEQELQATAIAEGNARRAAEAAARPAFQGAVDQARLPELIKSIENQIKTAEERDKKILEVIGPIGFSDNSKTDFTSKLPYATSAEGLRYQQGKSQIESDTQLIADFKAMLARLTSGDEKATIDRRAAAAEAAQKNAEKQAEDLAKQVNDLQRELSGLKAAAKLASSTEHEVGAFEKHGRDTDAKTDADIARRNRGRSDIETIENFDHSSNPSLELIRKATLAVTEWQSLPAGLQELVDALAGLDVSQVKTDVADAKKKIAEIQSQLSHLGPG